jgi:N6-L-threonylcarbamoyladenine synthase
MIHDTSLDLSFSGLKTAVRRLVESQTELTDDMRHVIAMEFEDAVTEVLVKKVLQAVDMYAVSSVLVSGGVSANTHIRKSLSSALQQAGLSTTLLVPPPTLSTDNAVMIAVAGYQHALRGIYADTTTLRAEGNLKL